MARRTDEERLARQRAYQQDKRQKDAQARRPGRDDVARTALFWIVRRMAERTPHEMELFQERMVEMLVAQGFDQRASDAVLDDLIAKYRSGEPPFRRKVHLLFPDGRPVPEPGEDD
nr:hypothetical protein [uncultured Gellertiella sp.]